MPVNRLIHIHVERVIGLVRQKYTILQSTLPINLIMCNEEEETSTIHVDKIAIICSALCGCCESVVSID